MSLYNEVSGAMMSDQEAQRLLAEGFARHGCIILAAPYKPAIGEVQKVAGLPMRVTRYATREEYETCKVFPQEMIVVDVEEGDHFFAVEVAD